MRRNVARVGRLLVAAALAYLTVGIVWTTAFGLAMAASATGTESPLEGLISFLGWFVLPSVLWPSSMSASIPGGSLIAIALLVVMTAPMITGVASRNAKRVASSRRSPRASPAEIVIPEREIPGISAIACAMPMTSASG